MGIKKLVHREGPAIKFDLGSGQGVLAFDADEGPVCLFLDKVGSGELHKLARFTEVTRVRYIGDEQLYRLIRASELRWPDFSKTIFDYLDHEVIYDAAQGKIRLAKRAAAPLRLVRKKKVLVIDDSKTIQKLLTRIIEQSHELEVMAVASSPSEARSIILAEKPDLITLDIHMPEMNGVEFLQEFYPRHPIPTVMISSVSYHEGPLVMEALASGAVTYIQKPSIENFSEISADVLSKLEEIARSSRVQQGASAKKSLAEFQHFDGLIAIGSSTGGTQALQEIFTALPDAIPPVVVVQHIPAVFSKALADRLNTLCKFRVKEAEHNEPLVKNTIYIAPGGKQMRVNPKGRELRLEVNDDPPLNRFQPSVDYLFQSLAELDGERMVAAILTGMGKDGARGLLALRQKSARTLAQDEASCVVFGMPREAIEIGAADKVVPLSEISSVLVSEFNKIPQRVKP